jgi:drug/metabolite transporter (DMT)-like permease
VDASRAKLIAAFAAVYIIWGSTYLAIRFAIETLPPFLMAGVRFVIAGGLLFGWALLRGAKWPEPAHWVGAAVVGTLLLLGGNGAVVWAEQHVPSGVAALLVAIVPCWLVLLDWLRPGGPRPTGRVIAGLLLGLAGVALLVGPASLMGAGRIDPLGALVLVIGSFSWAAGSIYSRQRRLPQRPLLATGMQMLAGGVALILAGLVAGEPARLVWSTMSLKSVLALAYLIVFGAIIGYSAYVWLLRASTPARVGTYAYVNPVVAVILGWALAGEVLTIRMLLAAAVIVSGVVLITWGPRAPRTGPAPAASCDAGGDDDERATATIDASSGGDRSRREPAVGEA